MDSRWNIVYNSDINEKYQQLNIGNINNVIYWSKFFEMIKDVPGDIVECGVARGRSLIILSALNKILGLDRQIFGYDSFEGFPEPASQDMSPRNAKKGEYLTSPSGEYKYTEDFVQTVLSCAGVDHVVIKKGFFDESLKSHPVYPIALLHLDGDLYEAHKYPLEILFDRVSSGGIIVFDDVLDTQADVPFPGARIAVKEFLGDRFDDLKTSMAGNCYYVKQ